MSSKTVSLREEACKRLCAARRYPGESFSAIVLRASWPETTMTGKALLDICRERGAVFDAAELDRVEAVKRMTPPRPTNGRALIRRDRARRVACGFSARPGLVRGGSWVTMHDWI